MAGHAVLVRVIEVRVLGEQQQIGSLIAAACNPVLKTGGTLTGMGIDTSGFLNIRLQPNKVPL
jgi:hypothetical protein